MFKPFFLLISLGISVIAYSQNFNNRIILGEEYARRQVQNVLKDKILASFSDTLIKTKEEAIVLAEPKLFRKFGKKRIVSQRPYEIYLIDGYWFITGTLPQRSIGGTFQIILKSEKGQLITIVHYQ